MWGQILSIPYEVYDRMELRSSNCDKHIFTIVRDRLYVKCLVAAVLRWEFSPKFGAP